MTYRERRLRKAERLRGWADKRDLKNLGWANSWRETPAIVDECKRKDHKTQNVDVGPPNRGIENVVTCEECGYVYRYDCSD